MLGARLQTTTTAAASAAAAVQVRRGRPFLFGRGRAADDESTPSAVQRVQAGRPADLALQQQVGDGEWVFVVIDPSCRRISRPRALRVFFRRRTRDVGPRGRPGGIAIVTRPFRALVATRSLDHARYIIPPPELIIHVDDAAAAPVCAGRIKGRWRRDEK